MMSEVVVAYTFNKDYLRATEVSIYSLDQDLINFTCPEEMGLLPKEYNVFPDDTEKKWASWPFPGNRTLAGALLDPAIFHYIGPDKPWVKPVPGDAYWLEAEAGFLRWRDSR